jgi:hypothetical protein
MELSAQTQSLDELFISLFVRPPEVVQKAPTPAHHHDQATTRAMVLDMILEVIGQILDTLGKQGNLDLGGSGIPFVKFVFLLNHCLRCVYHKPSQTCSGFLFFFLFLFPAVNLVIGVSVSKCYVYFFYRR